jgi:hypothetical protein
MVIFISELKFYFNYMNHRNGTSFYFKGYAGIGFSGLFTFSLINIVIYFFNITIGSCISIFLIYLIINHMFDKRYKLYLINEQVKDQDENIELETIELETGE